MKYQSKAHYCGPASMKQLANFMGAIACVPEWRELVSIRLERGNLDMFSAEWAASEQKGAEHIVAHSETGHHHVALAGELWRKPNGGKKL